MPTIADLYDAGRRITRMSGEDYGTYLQGYRDDSNIRRSQRNAVSSYMRKHVMNWETVVPPGEYGRITVLEDGRIDFCAGQYAPTEYYFHVLEVCRRMRQLREIAA